MTGSLVVADGGLTAGYRVQRLGGRAACPRIRVRCDRTGERMSGRVAGKVALVTGAGTGIGRAVCVRLAEEGADVVVTSQTAAHVEETCRLEAEASGRRAARHSNSTWVTARQSTRSSRRSWSASAGSTSSRTTPGIELVHGPTVVETTDEEWERVFRVNVTGTFYACRAAIPHMPDGSSIVNMASINSFVAWENDAPYTATKGAVMQLTRALALELAPREIRVNAVCPGVIDTPLTDAFLERAEDPEALRAEYAAASPLEPHGDRARGRELRALPRLGRGLVRDRLGARRRRRDDRALARAEGLHHGCDVLRRRATAAADDLRAFDVAPARCVRRVVGGGHVVVERPAGIAVRADVRIDAERESRGAAEEREHPHDQLARQAVEE